MFSELYIHVQYNINIGHGCWIMIDCEMNIFVMGTPMTINMDNMCVQILLYMVIFSVVFICSVSLYNVYLVIIPKYTNHTS